MPSFTAGVSSAKRMCNESVEAVLMYAGEVWDRGRAFCTLPLHHGGACSLVFTSTLVVPAVSAEKEW